MGSQSCRCDLPPLACVDDGSDVFGDPKRPVAGVPPVLIATGGGFGSIGVEPALDAAAAAFVATIQVALNTTQQLDRRWPGEAAAMYAMTDARSAVPCDRERWLGGGGEGVREVGRGRLLLMENSSATRRHDDDDDDDDGRVFARFPLLWRSTWAVQRNNARARCLSGLWASVKAFDSISNSQHYDRRLAPRDSETGTEWNVLVTIDFSLPLSAVELTETPSELK